MTMYAPMLIPLAGLTAGIGAAMCGAGIEAAAICLTIGVALTLILAAASRNPLTGFRLNRLHYIWIFLVFAGIGIFSASLRKAWQPQHDLNGYIAAEGRITSLSSRTSGDMAEMNVSRLIMRDGSIELPSNCNIIISGRALSCRVDDNVIASGSINLIADPQNSFSSGYADRMRNKGIFCRMTCSDDAVRVIGRNPTLSGEGQRIRDGIERFIEKTKLAKPTQNFLITILLGDRAYLSEDTRSLFADAGISHILALSGMHVAIISAIIMWLLFPLNFAGLYKVRLMAGVVIIFAYAFISGMAPSTIRAALMMTSLAFCIILERKNGAWNSLLLATFIILLFDPSALFDPGLQLSFLCVASLIFFTGYFNPIDQHAHPRLYAFFSAILCTLVATTATWCVTAYYFGTVPTIFLPSNLIALPLLPAWLMASVAYISLAAFGWEPEFYVTVIDAFPEWTTRVIGMMGGGDSALHFSPSAITVALWLAIVAAGGIAVVSTTKKICMVGIAACGTAFIICAISDLNAGTRDSFIIRSGRHEISALIREHCTEQPLQFPPGCISQANMAGQHIIVVDCPPRNIKNTTCDLLVIGGGIDSELPEILMKLKARKIVVHPSVRRIREASIMRQADSLGVECHSIRESGPYRYITELP